MPIPPEQLNRQFVSAFPMGRLVYLRMCEDCTPGLITSVSFYGSGGTGYGVTWGDGSTTTHYDFELSAEYSAAHVEDRLG